MRSGIRWLSGGALALMLSAATAQTPAPLLKHTFDEDASGWIGFGLNTRASISHQVSFNGQGALKFEYDIKKGTFSLLALQTPNGLLEKARTFRFWVQADYATTLGIILQEKDGARYYAPFAAPKGKWQKVELSTTDFTLMEGPGNPPDPDNRLDMDQVAAFAIGDVGQLFGMAGNADLEKLLNAQPGAHVFYIDDFTVTEEALPGAYAISGGDVRIDTFARPQVSWLSAGGVTLSRMEGGAPGERGLQADYRQAPGRIIALMRPFTRGRLQGMTRLSFTAASTQGVTLLVQVEESGGGKFNTTVDVPEGGVPKAVTVDFADMNPADDSSIKDRKVRPELVIQLVLLDATGLQGMTTERDNTLRITNLRASAGK
jgi:hypothetical protein